MHITQHPISEISNSLNLYPPTNLQNISLSKHELVQLANLRPQSAVDIQVEQINLGSLLLAFLQLLIENSEERLNDQQVQQPIIIRNIGCCAILECDISG